MHSPGQAPLNLQGVACEIYFTWTEDTTGVQIGQSEANGGANGSTGSTVSALTECDKFQLNDSSNKGKFSTILNLKS